MYIHKNRKFLYVHVQKTGGSFFKRLFRKKQLGRIGDKHCKVHDIHNEISNEYNDFYIFGMVRNPYSRLASAYRFNKDKRILALRKQVVNLDLNNPMKCDVEDFITWYDKCGCMVQSKYFYKDHPRQIIGKYEQLNSYIKDIFEKVDLPYKYAKRNHKTLYFGQYSIRDYLTNRAIEMINNICDEDFKRFGYKKVQFINEL